ncbi:hypothetical protein [Sandaracinobacteroides hominis]|uniref:hypothetical protein n=1 Tax=Sandaracinobacteroides hominis TaxID=2780086 RepID=UPI0018F7C71E|nr:hypothetical protein [Sandaracinobacteroides hominis]
MLSKADDYPVHQRPEPIATAGTDRNFYDRYFFNAQSADGRQFVAGALGVYPHLNVMDAAFCWMEGGVQRSIFASRLLGMERLDTQVGPISVEVVEPLKKLRLQLAPSEGISADILFEGRHAPIEEPRFTYRQGPRTLMDVTRMTQNMAVSGTATVDGVAHDLAGWRGTRDRSWGVRPIGAPDAQPLAPAQLPQFYWLWAPINFPGHALFFHVNDDGDGTGWNRSAVLVDLASGAETKLGSPRAELVYRPGTRRAGKAVLHGMLAEGQVEIELALGDEFQMHGIGYGHPKFAHGLWRGDLDVQGERIVHGEVDLTAPQNGHIQTLVSAELRLPGGVKHQGRGVLEQLFIGRHAPSGFKGLFDLA